MGVFADLLGTTRTFLVGVLRSRTINGAASQLQIEGTANTTVSHTQNSNDVNGPIHRGLKSRATAVGGVTAVQSGDVLWQLQAFGADGTNEALSARIRYIVDGTVSTGVVPGRLSFDVANASGVITTVARVLPTEQFVVENGTAALPALALLNDTDTGFYRIGANSMGWSAAGVLRTHVNASGFFADQAIHTAMTVGVTATTTLDETHTDIWFSLSGGNRTCNLPAAAGCTGREYGIGKSDSSTNTVTVDPSGAELINGASTFVISAQYEFIRIKSDGTGWLIQ